MQELNQQEVALVSGGHYDGGTIFDTAGNLIEAYAQGLVGMGLAAYKAGEAVTTVAVTTGNTLLGLIDDLFGVKK